jgi:Rod binding domain-containing protein
MDAGGAGLLASLGPGRDLAAAAARIQAGQGDRASLSGTVQEFEAIFLGQLLKGLRRTVPGAEEKSHTAQMYEELFDERVAGELARHGGIGLGAAVRAYLEQSPPGQKS